MELNYEGLAEAYLTHYRTKRAEDFWAFEQVSDLFRHGRREEAWAITSALIEKAGNAQELEYVAAGPLEDYINNDDAVAQVGAMAHVYPKWRVAVRSVWIGEGEGTFAAWEELRKELGFSAQTG